MGFLDDFAKRGPVDNPFGVAPPPPPKDDPAKSYSAMGASIDEAPDTTPGAPVLPCQRPWIEVTLLGDEDGEPIVGAPCTLTLPDGSTHDGTSDEGGCAHFDDVDLPSGAWQLSIEIEYDDEGVPKRYYASLVAAKPASAEEPDESDVVREDFDVDLLDASTKT